jgi:membrane associated rhomboid family serine protease
MPRQTVILLMIWFVICLSGILPIANYAHAGGLFVGGLWGYVSASLANR